MELRNKYFHGVQSYNYRGDREKELENILHKYECIFKSGYILPYQDIRKLYGDIDRHPRAHYNGDDRVSITLHEKHPEKVDIEWMKMYRDREENAFRLFVFQTYYPSSIVLNESVKDNYVLIPNGIYLERQVKEPISLEFMDAISIFPNSTIAHFFESGEDLDKHGKYFSEDFNIEFLKKIRELLIRYGYNVPIVSIVTGHEFDENRESAKNR